MLTVRLPAGFVQHRLNARRDHELRPELHELGVRIILSALDLVAPLRIKEVSRTDCRFENRLWISKLLTPKGASRLSDFRRGMPFSLTNFPNRC